MPDLDYRDFSDDEDDYPIMEGLHHGEADLDPVIGDIADIFVHPNSDDAEIDEIEPIEQDPKAMAVDTEIATMVQDTSEPVSYTHLTLPTICSV